MSSVLLDGSVDTAELQKSELLNCIKQEVDVMTDNENKILEESLLNEYQTEEIMDGVIDQIQDENCKFSTEETCLSDWNSQSFETQSNEYVNSGNDSTAHIFSKLEVKNELNKRNVEHVLEDCHSVKTETSEDYNTNEESKYIMNQIIDENAKVLLKEDFLASWTSDSVKTEINENVDAAYDSKEFIFSNLEAEKKLNEIKIENGNHKSLNNETECTKIKMKEVNEMDCFIQAEREAKHCDVPTSMDSKRSKLMSLKCNFCDYISPSKGYLQTHIQAVHLNLRNLKCHLCEFSSAFKPNLKRHIDLVHLKLMNHKCHICDYVSPRKKDLQSHIKSNHLKMKNEKCHLCDDSAPLQVNVQRHINAVHLKLRNHKCHLCDFTFFAKGHLQSHINSVHFKMRNHKCHLCNFTSFAKGHLQSHINTVHLKLRKYKCHLCDYSSSRKGDLQAHIKSVHLKMKNEKCHLCDYRTSLKVLIQRHINSVHLKIRKHKCHLCDFSSIAKGRLQTHINSVHLKLKERKCHKCELCDYTASTLSNLRRHLRTSKHLKVTIEKCD